MSAPRAYRGEDAGRAAAEDAAKGERFAAEADEWIEANPEAWAFMAEQARASAANRRRFGIGALCEVVRWQMRNVRGDGDFRLNNNHRARFARRLIEEVPECGPYITTRHSVIDMR